MRTLVIGDIHGCHTEFEALLAAVSLKTTDTLITLGDYIDRGPNSRAVVDRLIKLSATVRLIPILGNHEQMLLESRNNPEKLGEWVLSGGSETLKSYGASAWAIEVIPQHHWQFLEKTCVSFHETETHIFVHGSCYPDVPLAEQPDYMLRWEKFDTIAPHESGKTVICGHTPQKSGRPANRGFAICIDTKAHATGILTCLDASSGKIWQTQRTGQVAISHISDYEDCE